MSSELGKEREVCITGSWVVAVDKGEDELVQRERCRKARFLINRNF